MATNISVTSQSPYFDDFDPAKDYVQVLFRPGYPIQARELTTLQSFQREQIARLGRNWYREGSIVEKAEITVTNDAYELVLLGGGNSAFPVSAALNTASLTTIETLVGKVITDSTGVVKARVLASPIGVNNTSQVGNIYIKYISSETFDSDGGYIYANTTDNPELTQTFFNTYTTQNNACLASVSGGLYFVENSFVKINEQSVLISNTESNPSANIGFTLAENAITQSEDSSLFDNARGASNEGAPGAHRLQYTLTLSSKALNAEPDASFYRIATIYEGVRQEINEIGEEYIRLQELLARRTHDESGDYALTPFNPTVDYGDSDARFKVVIEPAKAYVKGYEITKTGPTRFFFDKPSTTKTTKDFKAPVIGTTKVDVTISAGDIGQDDVLLLRDDSDIIGVARGYAVKDTYRQGSSKTELYLYDIRMFTVLQLNEASVATTLSSSDESVSSGRTRALVLNGYGTAGVSTGNPITVIASTGKFRAGATLTSEASKLTTTVNGVTVKTLSQVTNITTDSDRFAATVSTGTFSNQTSALIAETRRYISTQLIDGAYENDFDVLSTTSLGIADSSLNPANGVWNKYTIDNEGPAQKTLKFGYMKLRNDPSTTAGYGWSAAHKEVSLHYPDIYEVYQINESSDRTFDNGRFTRINISTSGVVPQGSLLRGDTSGNLAIVALRNATNITEATLADSEGSSFHITRKASGSASQLEIVFIKGTSFTANENLTVETPGEITEGYLANVTYLSATAEVGTNVTGNFHLDDGQRKEYYDIGRLVRKDNVPAPSNDLIVFFSYFEADTSGHYFSTDSYAQENFYRVDSRFFDGLREIKPFDGVGGVQLRNSFDFRNRVTPVSNYTKTPFNFANRSFALRSRIMPDSVFKSDIVDFLGRIDLVSLEKTSDFKIISGIPSLTPSKPKISADGMPLFYVQMQPVVRYPETDVFIYFIDNRRYTMRDIGELESRISTVEENLALTMLELQALNDDVEDRTKSGFVVEPFASEKNPDGILDTAHPEFNATIDILNKQLLPAQTPGVPVEMTMTSSVNVNTTFFPGWVTRSFTEEAFATQMEATQGQRINPFATWAFTGDITLTPSEDNWRIRRDDYFIELFGRLLPFEGNAQEFAQFNRITTTSPGGRSTSIVEWVGRPRTTTTRSRPHTVRAPDGVMRMEHRTTTTQGQRTITRTTFDSPRATGRVTSTLTDSQVIQNPQDYFMRSITVSYSAKNLKPNTAHNIKFGETIIGTRTSNANGEINSSFTIPAQTYRAGTQTFSVEDTDGGYFSSGFAQFRSIGHLDTFRTVSETATEVVTRSSVRDTTRSVSRRFTDPIAQMFMLPNKGDGNKESSVLTSIDIWFAVVDQRPLMDKVKIEIRETVNGYPGGPDEIIGETDYLDVPVSYQTTSITENKAFNAKFKEPIILRAGVEYAVVIKSPSDAMEVYVAEMGERLLDGTGIHTSQPNVGGYYGSFFVSQNASTWTAQQSKDLTFRLKRAKFESATSSVTLSNQIKNTDFYRGDIGAVNQGLTMETFEFSKHIKVYHPNHGFNYDGAQVTISGVQPGTYSTWIDDYDSDNPVSYIVTDSDLNGTHTVLYPTLDTYFINIGKPCKENKRLNTGTFTTFATQDIVFDSLLTNFMVQKDEGDFITMDVTSTETSSLNLFVDTNKLDETYKVSPTRVTVPDTVEIDSLIEFDTPRIVRSSTNTTGNDLIITLSLESGSTYSSPVMKMGSNTSPIVFRNVVGGLLVDSDIYGGFDGGLETVPLRTRDLDSDVTRSSTDDSELSFISFIQGVQSENEHSAAVTKQIDLEIPADGFTIRFEADMEPSSAVEAAYKVRAIGDDTPFEDLEWIDFPYAQQITEENYGNFSTDPDPKQYTMRAETPFDFGSFKIRLRLRTQNEALVPKVANLRIIADV